MKDLIDNTEYHWQVTAEDQSGATFTTPLQSFVVNTENDLPSEFALLSPTNESMVTELMPSFHWEEPTDADFNGSIVRYDFYLNTSNSFTGIEPIELTSNDYVYSAGLNEDQLYYWKVVAVDNSGGETVSECWSFYTNSENSAPSEFALLTPSANEETGLLPTFNWSESTDPDLYDELSYTLNYGLDPSNMTNVTPQQSSQSNDSFQKIH